MSVATLLFIAFGGAFALVWLLHYVPLKSTILGKPYSPRLLVAKFVAPFDAFITILLVAGAWVGITTVTGIGSMVYNVLTGLGLSLGAVFVRKVLVPRWETDYNRIVENIQ